ncbi:hypothetical protein [Roseisolibacter agri]|uniref:Uncharacterized protein n=1 Tax=Roseisolibacter agri TaxID=2014610 RepID=A0AA37QIR7_9BACT|nr:hypothetical protein [Roseisolibacter agri]GLC27603.1 hypothetical protein rosag_41160 [Roseisolibacter agri]
MRPQLALLLVFTPLAAAAQEQPQPRFAPVARTEPTSAEAAQERLRSLRLQAADSAVRYAGVANGQRKVARSLVVAGAAIVAGSYAQWVSGPTRRGMTAGGAALLGAGLGVAGVGVVRNDAADRSAATAARWRDVAEGRAR